MEASLRLEHGPKEKATHSTMVLRRAWNVLCIVSSLFYSDGGARR